jgi:hypothetical protein
MASPLPVAATHHEPSRIVFGTAVVFGCVDTRYGGALHAHDGIDGGGVIAIQTIGDQIGAPHFGQ